MAEILIPRLVTIDLREGTIVIDGVKFPYPVVTDSVSVSAPKKSLPGVSLTILADQVEVIGVLVKDD